MLLIIPSSFASDNSSDIIFNENNQIIMPDSVYFDSSVENDGNGTQSNPYKYFASDKIGDNAVVYLADGEYLLNESFNAGNLTIIGQSRNNTIIHGNGNSLSALNNLDISYLTLNNLRIINNKNFKAFNVAFENNHVSEYGGAVTVESTAVSTLINDSLFIANSAVRGGAIYVNSNAGTFYVDNSTFVNNTAGESGGAIFIENHVNSILTNSIFVNNNASSGVGGAMFSNNSKVVIQASNFAGSKARYGAAIYDTGSDLTLIATAVTNNVAENAGGAIYKEEGSFAMISSSFENNTALEGAAIYGSNMDSFTVIASNFTSNIAESGKVIYSTSNRKEYFVGNIINDNYLAGYIKSPDITLLLKDSNPLVLSCVFSGDLFNSQSFTLNYLMPFNIILKDISSIFNFDNIIPIKIDTLFDAVIDIAKDSFFPLEKFKFDKDSPPDDISHLGNALINYLTTLSIKSNPGGVEAIVSAGNYNIYNISKSDNSKVMMSLNAFGITINNNLGFNDFDISVITNNHSFDYSLGYFGENPISLDVSDDVNLDFTLFNTSYSPEDNSLKLINEFCNLTFDDFTYTVDVLVNGDSSSFNYLGNSFELFNAPFSMDVNEKINYDLVFFNISLDDNSLELINKFCNVTFDDFTYSVDVLVNGESSSFVYLGNNFELLTPLSLDVNEGIDLDLFFFTTSCKDNSLKLMSGLCNFTFDSSAYSVDVLANNEYSSFNYMNNNLELVSAVKDNNLDFALFDYYCFENNSFKLINDFFSLTFDNLDYSINLIPNNVEISGSLIPKFGEFIIISFK